jgi:hypothetical protein
MTAGGTCFWQHYARSMQPPGFDQITSGAARLFKVRRNVAIHDARLQRALRDHSEWLDERDQQLQHHLMQLNAKFEARGAFRSGTRLRERADAKSEALRELRKARNRLDDLINDILNEETLLECTYRRLRRRPVAMIAVSAGEAEIESRWSAPEGGQDGTPVIEIRQL